MIDLNSGEKQSKSRGQAMVEYALILAMLAVAFGAAIAATGPAIGNVFCNVVHNIGGSEVTAQGTQQCGNAAPNLFSEGGDPNKFWATVTWVAAHPQGETPFPTPIRRAPTSIAGGLQTSTYTPTSSNTPTNTNTPTKTNTPTNTLVPTAGPSPTNSDFAFTVPFVDQISNPEWWRLDLADDWKEQWYSVGSHSTASTTVPYTITLSSPGTPMTVASTNPFSFNLATSGPPSGSGVVATDHFGGRFTRSFQVTQSATYNFTIAANDAANVYLDGTIILWNNDTVNPKTTSSPIVVVAGMHTIQIDYVEDTNNATLSLTMSAPVTVLSGTPVAPAKQDNSCSWGQTSNANNPVSVPFMFEANPGQITWPAGQTCYLELRGYVDLTGHTAAQLSFWDLWDFSGGSVTAQLQIGKYSLSGGSMDRTPGVVNWQTVPLHTSPSKNYAWTRNQVDLSSYSSLGTKVTFRFVITGTSGSVFRWFLDDMQMLDPPAVTTPYTINKVWNLDTVDQMDDFVFDDDANRTIQKYGLSNVTGPWRWQLTSTNAHSGMGWDDSPGYNYQNITGLASNPSGTTVSAADTEPRIHYLQFKNSINVVPGTAPATDTNGNQGVPILSFWQAYQIFPNASIRVEYYDTTNSVWATIPNQGLLVDYAVPTGSSRTNLTMQPVKIDLTNVPGWNTGSIKLRFAMYVQGDAATTFGQGWYIDDIKLEREKTSPFVAYPFIDDAEDPTFTAANWQSIGGKWGAAQVTGIAGALNTATSYTDSPPSANYDPNDTQELQMQYAIDLLHDSPSNSTDFPGRLSASNPVLTFWHQRYLGAGSTFSVELWTPRLGTWKQIWVYLSSSNGFPTQRAWQRVEINLPLALKTAYAATGKTWATIVSNADGQTDDDDIKIRFRLDTGGGTPADGVYVDEIHIEDASTTMQNLWTGTVAGVAGNGPYVDSIENVSPLILPGAWNARWYAGGQWNTTNAAGYYKSSSLALSDSPANYLDSSFSTLEMVPIINMTNTPGTSYPMLSFWTRYDIGMNASFRVEIAYQNAGTLNNANGYDQIGGWSPWQKQSVITTKNEMVGVPATNDELGGSAGPATVNTWLRGQVDLTNYIGRMIRVRFVASVPSGANLADGQYLDEIAFTYSPTQLPVPFVDTASSTLNWVTEGTWGLAGNYFIGNGSSSSDFGNFSWVGTYYDCENSTRLAGEYCNDNQGNVSTTMANILTRNANLDYLAGDTYVTTGSKVGPETGLSQINDINFKWTDGSQWPLNNQAPQGVSNQASDTPLSPGFDDTFAARWTRTVTLSPGNYSFSTISIDGVRVYLTATNPAITGLTARPAGGLWIINDWGNHVTALDYGNFTVTGTVPITMTLKVEYYEDYGTAQIVLNATKSTFSFTDSPNTPAGNNFTQVNAIYPGNSSLMMNGYIDLSGSNAPVLHYQRLYDLAASNTLTAEVSTDGGFFWTVLPQSAPVPPATPVPGAKETITGPITVLPPANYWEQRNIDLGSYKQAHVMIRFRLDTRGALTTGDGVYITNINITP